MAQAEGKIARRYARALIEGSGRTELEALRGALQNFSALWEQSAELQHALLNPGTALDQRGAALRAVALRIVPDSERFAGFLALLLENHRLEQIGNIRKAFEELLHEINQTIELEIVSAVPLPADEQAAIRKTLEAQLGRQGVYSWHVDPSIVGGLIVRSGDKLLDASVKGALAKARESLTVQG